MTRLSHSPLTNTVKLYFSTVLGCGKFDRDGRDKMSIFSIVSSMTSLPHLICWVPRFGLLRSELEAIGHSQGCVKVQLKMIKMIKLSSVFSYRMQLQIDVQG